MYSLQDLRELMRALRDPDSGCPWDLKQDFRSIAPHTVEECFELVDAIEQGELAQVRQELGDVLFQVIFYAQLAEEGGDFRFEDVVNDIVSKLLRRHPHVFPDGTLGSAGGKSAVNEAAVKARWEEIKAEERVEKAQHGLLDDIPAALPALSRAQKLQKRAARVGFDWDGAAGVVTKLREELEELEQALTGNDPRQREEELGDLLFTAVNLARHLDLDAEATLRAASRKFETRFRYLESRAAKPLSDLGQPALESLWEEAKSALARD